MMRRSFYPVVLLALSVGLAGCAGPSPTPEMGPQVDIAEPLALTPQEIAEGRFTPEIMWKMGRLGSVSMSPDREAVLYSVTHYNALEDRGATRIYRQGIDDPSPTLVEAGAHSPAWVGRDGAIAYAKVVDGASQVFVVGPDGLATQVTSVEGGVNAFWFSPDGTRLLYAKSVQVKPTTRDRHPDMDKANVRIIDSLMYRHWDYWVEGQYSHLFLAEVEGGKAGPGRDLMAGEPWDSPMAPYFSEGEVTWGPAGDAIYYTCKKQDGRTYATSTNSNIYRYELAEGTHTLLTGSNPGYDRNPVVSPDGGQLLWQRMVTPGYESDRARLMHLDLATGQVRELLPTFDQNADAYQWSDDGKTVYILSELRGTSQLFALDMASLAVQQITQGAFDINWASQTARGDWLMQRTQLTRAAELYRVRNGEYAPFTRINEAIYEVVRLSQVEERWIATSDGGKMLTWVVYPPDFDPSKKYPALLYCQGGPQNTVSQFWSYRWNLQLMASQGYIVVAPNRHGVPSFGQAWNLQISGDYSGQNIRDYLAAIDDVAKEPWCDAGRLGAVGASYGGYSVYYLAGVHQGRFKAFIAHNGMFNLESFYAATEETFFANHDLGGAYWESANRTAMRSYANSPHRLVHKWDTPILVIVGERDYRIPYTEGLQAFNAAQLRGVPSRLLVFPDETHLVLKPQNSLVWQREFFGWLDRWLK